MSDLIPSEVVREILLRLPGKSLLRLRCVCKEWRSVIDDPSFVRSLTNIQLLSSPALLIKCAYHRQFYRASLNLSEPAQTIDAITPIAITPIDWGMLEAHLMNRWVRTPMTVSRSCDGLILMFDSGVSLDSWVIANPLTRKYHELPRPRPDDDAAAADAYKFGYCYGFGYDCAADDYKVVMIDRRRRTLIYSLRSDDRSWRRIGDCPVSPNYFPRIDRAGVFLNGALHWQSEEESEEEWKIALDLGTEEYRLLPLPPVTAAAPTWSALLLEAFGGRLFCFYQKMFCYEGWVMNEYGIGKSWTMLFSVEVSFYKVFPPEGVARFQPVAYYEREKRVLVLFRKVLFWVDTDSGSAREVITLINGVDGSDVDFEYEYAYARLWTESPFPLGGGADDQTAGGDVDRTPDLFIIGPENDDSLSESEGD